MSHLAHCVFFSAVLSVTADFICWESMYKTSPFAVQLYMALEVQFRDARDGYEADLTHRQLYVRATS